MRILVTGGAGFIGNALAAHLVAGGHEVVVADLKAPRTEVHDAVVGDLRDPDVLGRALAPGTVAVAHLAAATSVLGSMAAPEDVYRSNVGVTQALLERGRQLGLGRLVLASTNAVVGSGASGARINEDSPLVPLTPYGATKAAAEMLMCAYRHSYGMATVSLRLTNVYGPGMWATKDTMVARLMRAARSGTGVRIHGHGRLSRDYVYLDDVVAALAAAAGAGPDPDLDLPDRVVMGSGRSVSVLELHREACAASGVDIPFELVDSPPGEMEAVEIDRAHADRLGLEARIGLPDGLRATWAAWPEDDATAG